MLVRHVNRTLLARHVNGTLVLAHHVSRTLVLAHHVNSCRTLACSHILWVINPHNADIIPSQMNPSPVYPVLQLQVKELLVSVHTALMLQGLDLHPEKIATS